MTPGPIPIATARHCGAVAEADPVSRDDIERWRLRVTNECAETQDALDAMDDADPLPIGCAVARRGGEGPTLVLVAIAGVVFRRARRAGASRARAR